MNYIYLLSPNIFIFITSIFFPVTDNAGKDIVFRPPESSILRNLRLPGYVFGIVWPILLLLLGYSWTLRPNILYLYIILTLLLSLWLILYKLSKKIAFYEIILTLLFSIFVLFYKYNTLSSILLIPLILWLSFASVLNYYSIQ
jgi:benzodiazapine receptor